jgi:hypothetical protein
MIIDIFDQATLLTSTVCLNHYNEPLLDKRIVKIAQMAKNCYFRNVFLHTNGDLLDYNIAAGLDGVLDRIAVTLYPGGREREEIQSLFQVTVVDFQPNIHVATHYSPSYDVALLAKQRKDNLCLEPDQRLIINHKGDYLFCCECLISKFDLGEFTNISLWDYWNGKRKILAEFLKYPGGRVWNDYCYTCPRK